MLTDWSLVVTHMVAVSSRCNQSSSSVVVVRCASCPASTGLGHMCTDLGQQAEPGVSDLGHRGQPEEAVSDWNSLSSIWHKRMAFRKHSLSSYLAQEDGIREALCIKLFGTRVWHSGSTQNSSYLAQEDVAGHIWKLIVKQV